MEVRTVRRYLRAIGAGATGPRRSQGPGKLERFSATIEAKVGQGLSAVQSYQDLCGEAGLDASYETVKRRFRALRPKEPSIYTKPSSN